MAKFIISTDSSADLFKSYLKESNVYSVVMKRIQNGHEIGEIFNSEADFDAFYEEIKKGALPTTTLVNEHEMKEYFENILKKEKNGDIIHIALSSGLSGTCANAIKAAEGINKTLNGRKVYVIDSLIATMGVGMLVDRLIEMRDAGVSTQEAISETQKIRDHQQAWVIVDDLFHLKRGGRISGFKAMLGTIMNIKPIIIVSQKGKLAIEHRAKGPKNAIQYVLEKAKQYGVDSRSDFLKNTIYLVRTSKSENYDELKKQFLQVFPNAKIKEGAVGPIVGTHLGSGCAVLLFEGAKRLDI